jgi:hypothetical protein
MMLPEKPTAEQLQDTELMQQAINEHFEPVDRHYSMLKRPIAGVSVPALLEDEIVYMLAIRFRPFLSVLAGQIIRKANSRMERLPVPGTSSTFTISGIKEFSFITFVKDYGKARCLVITTGKRLPNQNLKL